MARSSRDRERRRLRSRGTVTDCPHLTEWRIGMETRVDTEGSQGTTGSGVVASQSPKEPTDDPGEVLSRDEVGSRRESSPLPDQWFDNSVLGGKYQTEGHRIVTPLPPPTPTVCVPVDPQRLRLVSSEGPNTRKLRLRVSLTNRSTVWKNRS